MRSVLRLLPAILSLLPSTALATWSPSGNSVCTAPGYQGELIALPIPAWLPPDGPHYQSMFVVWSDSRDSIPAVTDLYQDLVDPAGEVTHAPNGKPVIVAPGFQGHESAATTAEGWGFTDVIVAWSDDRNGPLDVYAKELTFGGVWPVPVCTAAGSQHAVQVAGAQQGGGIVAWLDQRAGIDAVYAQRLDRFGVAQWGGDANGIPICTLPFTRNGLRIVRDGADGAYVGWVDTRTGAPRTYVTRLNVSGAPVAGWPIDGVEVVNRNYASLDRLVPDGAGGVYATMWAADTPVAQRLDANGTRHTGWGTTGVVLRATPVGGFLQDAVLHGDGLVVLWAEDDAPDKTFEINLLAQRLLGDGTRASGWDPDGMVVCDAGGSQTNGRLVDGGHPPQFFPGPPIVAVWEDGRTFGLDPDVYAVRLEENGTRAAEWPANGVLVAGGPGRQSSPCPVWDGLGGVMVAYLDDHDFNSTQTDVYAQIVNSRGQVDVPRPIVGGVFSLAAPVPNPAAHAVSLALAWPAGVPARAEVVDVLGRRVRALGEVRGATTIRWDLTDDAGRRVAPGLYVVRARGGDRDFTRTVIVRH